MSDGYYKITKTPKQQEAVNLVSSCKISLLEGGSRSGKTFIILYMIILRALMVPSRHLICRYRFSHCIQTVGLDTLPKILDLMGLTASVKLNQTKWFLEFQNGSQIWLGGIDDKKRLEKILGSEYATIFINETSQVSYDAFEILLTRLNPPKGMNGKYILDYNPPSITHWGYKIFHKRLFPDDRPVPDNDYFKLKINPEDNAINNSDDYLETLSMLSVAKRKRFLSGEYGLDSGSLWRRAWIKYTTEIPEGFWRIVIGVDPSGTVDGDQVGIIVAGLIDNEYIVLEDYTCSGTPAFWSAEISAAYKKWNADSVVAETNYGGDMVEFTIQQSNPDINVIKTHSSRGKIVRAEPISALYEQGKVKHRKPFFDLEDEMCVYEPGAADSPNRMDALVFAISELAGDGLSMLDVL